MTGVALLFLDGFFHLQHLGVIVFNLFGWIPARMRRLHRWCVALTAFCWFVLGWVMRNFGYCPLTDWHWQVKHLRGEGQLPGSYVTYMLNEAGVYPRADHVDLVVAIIFGVVAVVAFWPVIKRRF